MGGKFIRKRAYPKATRLGYLQRANHEYLALYLVLGMLGRGLKAPSGTSLSDFVELLF